MARERERGRRGLRWGAVLAGVLLAGCATGPRGVADGGLPDGGARDGGVVDGGAQDGGASDGGLVERSQPTPAPRVLRRGTAGLLLRGVVLTPEGALPAGEVLVADGGITCVAPSCGDAPGAGAATVIETEGTISPGLVDAHNHLAYDFLRPWTPEPPRLFQNRYEWADDPGYEAYVRPYARYRSTGTHFCPAAKWGELRALVHGTTTVQGGAYAQTCIDWGVRNAEHYHGLGHRHLRTFIGNVRDLTDADARGLLADFDAASAPITRYAVHLQEGFAGAGVLQELDSFAGRDPRENRHRGLSLLREEAVLIHAMALTPGQVFEIAQARAKVVWSPSSNVALYGQTAPIEALLGAGVAVGLGPDWTLSGEPELLSELRFGRAFGHAEGIAALTPERLWRMATADGAEVVGLGAHLGRIEVGQRADLVVFGRRGPEPHAAVIESRAADVRLVLIDGVGLYGDASLREATAQSEHCEPFDACGVSKYLCVQVSPNATARRNERLADVRAQLLAILEGTGYPADEQYGRGEDLLELVDCTR